MFCIAFFAVPSNFTLIGALLIVQSKKPPERISMLVLQPVHSLVDMFYSCNQNRMVGSPLEALDVCSWSFDMVRSVEASVNHGMTRL